MPYTPTLADIPETPSTGGYKPTLADIPEEGYLNKAAKAVQPIIAAGSGFRQGVLDAASDLGNLSINLLKSAGHVILPNGMSKSMDTAIDKGSAVVSTPFNQVKSYTENNPIDVQAQQNSPIAAAVGKGVGYTLGSTAGLTPGFNLANKVLQPAIKSMPILSKSPVLSEAVSQGTIGAGLGAESNPEHPILGAIQGFIGGAFFGAAAGKYGYSVDRASKIINRVATNALETGGNVGSHETVNAIKTALSNEGITLRQLDVKALIKESINNKLDEIRPDNFNPQGQSPINILKDKVSQNFPEIKAQKDKLYQPINDVKQTFTPENFTSLRDKLEPSLNVKLPQQDTVDMSLKDMLNYRQKLEALKTQAKIVSKTSMSVTPEDAYSIQKLKNALNKDIASSAEQAGVKNELQQAEAYYKNNYKPFEVYGKDLSKFTTDPSSITDMQSKITKALVSKRPNFTMQANIMKTLGPEGKELLGWGQIETLLTKNQTAAGIIKPDGISSGIQEFKAKGIYDNWSPEQQQVATGIGRLIQSGKENLQGLGPGKEHLVLETLSAIPESLIRTRPGISLLKYLGSKSTSAEMIQGTVKKLITGTLAGTMTRENSQKQTQ